MEDICRGVLQVVCFDHGSLARAGHYRHRYLNQLVSERSFLQTRSFRLTNSNNFLLPVKPKSPSEILVEKVEARSVFLRWTVGNTGRAPIITYTIDYNNESNYRPETATWRVGLVVRDAHQRYPLFPLEVPNLKPYAEYRFRVTANNIVGDSPPSNASGTVRTAEDSK